MQKLYEETNIQAIADAIRSKNGSQDTYKTKDMAAAIEALEGADPNCNGMHIPEEALVISGECSDRFSNNSWNWFIGECGDKITTKDITAAGSMFGISTTLEEVPFDINFKEGVQHDSGSMFSSCWKLRSIGDIVNYNPRTCSSMFANCQYLRYLPAFINSNWDYAHTYKSFMCSAWFNCCHSLRRVSEELLADLYGIGTSTTYCHLYNMFSKCYALDEIKGLNPTTGTLTSNMFSATFSSCARAKDITFLTQEDGTPYEANWSKQTIDLSTGVGVNVNYDSYIAGYNSGITADKKVVDDASYAALKNDPDWFTGLWEYGRYNKTSAVNTINSLPDVSAGSGNTIKFRGEQGSATDGGAINTLTEEEIAVAAAKGWTVTLV